MYYSPAYIYIYVYVYDAYEIKDIEVGSVTKYCIASFFFLRKRALLFLP